MTSYGGMGDKIRLTPVKPTMATNDFHFEPRENRDYQIRLPKNQLVLNLLATGTGTIQLTIWLETGERVIAGIPIQDESARKTKTIVKLSK